MKTPEQMYYEWRQTFDESLDERMCVGEPPVNQLLHRELGMEVFLAGYKAGFEIGCMKGSIAMQSTLDEDYRLTQIIDHQKLASRMTKKEVGDE